VTTSIPNENAQGHITWNPSVGLHHTPAKVKRESYGGIIGALQDQVVAAGSTTKAYPENFAGIIAAIQDLQGAQDPGPPTHIGPKPPGGDVIIDGDGNPIWIITEEPDDGDLWFDTRQGRLFTWIDTDWYQTNGGDGIPIVTDDGNPPLIDVAVPGQMWYDKQDNNLFIFSGDYQAADGTINQDGDGALVWKLVADLDQDFIQTTATLPLSVIGPKLVNAYTVDELNYLPTDDPSLFTVQKDYNEFLFAYLTNLDEGLSEFDPVHVSDTPPATPAPGQLWYDTESLEMSIAYEDDDSIQWVPVSAAYNYDDDLTDIRSLVTTETRQREREIYALQERLNSIDISDATEIQNITASLASHQQQIDALLTIDLNPYLLETTFNSVIASLNTLIASNKVGVDSLGNYATTASVTSQLSQVTAQVNTKASKEELDAVEASIPTVDSFVTQADITTAIENITTEYLPRNGGTLKGSFIIEKQDYSLPAFDMSGASWHSRDAFKLAANAPADGYTSTFGTTDALWEYAWNFSENEDFCWIYNDTNKVFSITKEGPACSTLVLGDFGDNTANGRVIHNKIDVKDRLNTYQTAFEQMRQGVSNATDFDSLKANILSALASV
jgi:hypothetical protein